MSRRGSRGLSTTRGRGSARLGARRPEAQFVRELLRSPRFEVLPTKTVVDAVARHLPTGRILTVTASESLGLPRTLRVTEELQRRGYRAVPHLAARMISGRGELEEVVGRLQSAGVDSVFVPAGDAAQPAGEYESSLDLLRDLADMGAPFAQVGIAGYPESHPTIPDEAVVRAMADKRGYATHVVSNLCFDPTVLSDWVEQIRSRGETLPLLIGVAGRVERTRLLKTATAIGVGESTRFLAKNKSLFARILTPGGYSPEKYLRRALPALSRPEARVEGLHVYTFNQIGATEAWRAEQLARLE